LFSPVEIDGKLLVDGGVTNNYPVEEIKKLGADIVIGVDVQDDLTPQVTQGCHKNPGSDIQPEHD
jgi:NTE family protein